MSKNSFWYKQFSAMNPLSITIFKCGARPVLWHFHMSNVSNTHWKTWIHMSFTWPLYCQWLQCVSLMCCCIVYAAVVQLWSSQRCCLVTACWAGGRIKCCRCVWGNLWRALEEGVSHSSWSSSRTESWTSHLFKGFLPAQYLALSDTDHRDSQRALKYK